MAGLKEEAWRLEPARYAIRETLQTRYGDMDANRHLNNVALAQLVEEARVRFHRHLFGEAETGPALERRAIVIAHVAIDYLAEGRYGPDVQAGVAVEAVGRRSYRLGIGLFQDGAPIALAHAVMVLRAGGADAVLAIDADLGQRLAALAPRC